MKTQIRLLIRLLLFRLLKEQSDQTPLFAILTRHLWIKPQVTSSDNHFKHEFLSRLLIFFSKLTFSNNSFRNTIIVPNSLDPDQAGDWWRWCSNSLKEVRWLSGRVFDLRWRGWLVRAISYSITQFYIIFCDFLVTNLAKSDTIIKKNVRRCRRFYWWCQLNFIFTGLHANVTSLFIL